MGGHQEIADACNIGRDFAFVRIFKEIGRCAVRHGLLQSLAGIHIL
jgi:hypothetical protein